jgi:hypothetical protein
LLTATTTLAFVQAAAPLKSIRSFILTLAGLATLLVLVPLF